MFRPDNPLLPITNMCRLVITDGLRQSWFLGTDIKRPKGQNRVDADVPPILYSLQNFDYEMEVGFLSARNEMGETIPIENAEEHIFGLCFVNDWSARDIQAWEYQPLGPFLKNFANNDFAVCRDDGSTCTVSDECVCA